MNKFSKKGAIRQRAWLKLRDELLEKDGYKSLLSGKPATGGEHHINGRIGKLLLNPFNLIPLTLEEHTIEQQHLPGCHTKEELLQIVYYARIKQGYEEG